MKKPTSTTKNADKKSEQGKSPAHGGGHEWQGEAVERNAAPASHENPEAAAARAEGNAPFPAEQSRQRQRADVDPTTFDLSGNGDDEATTEDDDNAAELKRQAAAEDHAASTSKHPPHGRL